VPKPLTPVPDLRTILVIQNVAKIVQQHRDFHRQAIRAANTFQRQHQRIIATVAAIHQARAILAGIAGSLPAPANSSIARPRPASQAEHREALRKRHWCYW